MQVVRKCEECGNEFEARRRDAKYCSRSCGKHAEQKRNIEKYRVRRREYYAQNRESIRERCKAKYRENLELSRAKNREYAQKHRAEKRQRDRIYKDRTRHGGKRKELLEENGLVCSVCGGKFERLFDIISHHVTFDNQNHAHQILLCRACHCKLHKPHLSHKSN